MIELELDGKHVSAESGASILEVAIKEGKYIPHFCYHKKLSIAANCRMCLVEVEKSAKPLPACSTPVTEGMKIHTCSKLAVEAQKGVMEFLLINHPLDCPICDQGGECQLQDLAVGYGRSHSRFEEEKRAVTNKDLGPLVSTQMTRCIHCSRCVRFTDEIAGYQELGMSYRNNHVEVMPFIGKTVDSELSGNIIDICPVGALTSKPFRHSARTWELSRRKSISAHDSLGSNLVVQVDKYHKVVRVLPHENEELNECWISDRDRFSYEGLYHQDRVTKPMIKQNNEWLEVGWETAIDYVAKSINGIKIDHGADQIGVIASPTSTVEELYLLQKLMRKLEIYNLDSRLTQNDFALDGKQSGVSFLGSDLNDFLNSKSVLVVGSIIRSEQPLLTAKLRKAVKHGMELNVINTIKEDLLCEVKTQITCDPREFAYRLAQLVKATGGSDTIDLSQVEITNDISNLVSSVKNNAYIVLGEVAKMQSNYSELIVLAQQLAKNINGKSGFLPTAANEVGAELVGFVPFKAEFNQAIQKVGMNIKQMLENTRKAYFILNTELECDAYDSRLVLNALNRADAVMVMSAYTNEHMKAYADVILPITPFTETPGSFVNLSGVWQKFNAVTRPLGDSKPTWKVLRVIANRLNIEGFEQNSIEDVRNEIPQILECSNYLSNNVSAQKILIKKPELQKLIRVGLQSMYGRDSITRRALSLQSTKQATLPTLILSKHLADKFKVSESANLQVKQEGYVRDFSVTISDILPNSVIMLATNDNTHGFAGRFDAIEVQV
ncbi:MAG: NADH-quinone oxidoreductase subunit NuoG [Neisseriaceae bacterium]